MNGSAADGRTDRLQVEKAVDFVDLTRLGVQERPAGPVRREDPARPPDESDKIPAERHPRRLPHQGTDPVSAWVIHRPDPAVPRQIGKKGKDPAAEGTLIPPAAAGADREVPGIEGKPSGFFRYSVTVLRSNS